MFTEIKQGIAFTVVTMALFGGAYHLLVWGVGRTMFASRSEGSLVRLDDGTIAGSRLVAQAFVTLEYFHPRPSAVDYDAASTGGSNFGPSNVDHLDAVRARIDAIAAEERVDPSGIPSEMVTASGAGLDPDIPPAAAEIQAARIASARGVAVDRVRELVHARTEPPSFGFLGRARVNVLDLNLALDRAFGVPPAARGRRAAQKRRAIREP
ncbi:MAG: potassium-transporting ATPase subunit KdpC [Vicinamibacterales bacterium]